MLSMNFKNCWKLNNLRGFSSSSLINSSFKVNITPVQKTKLDLTQVNNELAESEQKTQIDAKFSRRFKLSSTYDPFDFSLAKLHLDTKFKTKSNSKNDIFEVCGINPLDLYSNPEYLSHFLSSTGRILHRDVTGLSVKNQRRMSKAVRRCQAIGLLPKTCRDSSFVSAKRGGARV
ncbi:hypothetical protein Kpol_478p20 [Vanderwaltozyma polyspora DSM 70294]|uniref:Small ribosomal subunit protein bS18m n=1 Tax=Vanderwaltozyma polyspora (strain ATCC 22028 / DSM 70294 / BCRC 21397 / CBS 2163 / NBRC 10782 / NRRL Y-8283 / UCD 57-17) TaxID=436907 RepID=A7TPN9_VANPO|nr:uncharacterized protein Kpol_478p20 [Vanderwaltozyma polyspora DSM 70294]EDO15784.1 hypothetical protein Kpol_478p20 [Vanderwaltozyma polyspora DSM 70294]